MKFILEFLDVESLRIYLINIFAISFSLTSIHTIFSIMLMAASFVYTMLKVLSMIESRGRSSEVVERAKRIKKSKKK